MSSHLSLASQTLPQSQSFCLAQDRMLQEACYEAVVCHGWIMAQFYHWHQSLWCDWRAKYKNEQVFLIAADKMILVLLAEWFCRCDLSLCPWFLSSLLSPGLAAYLIQTAFPVASAPFHYFIPNLLWWWDFTVAATALKDNQKWFRNAFTRLFPECQLKACVWLTRRSMLEQAWWESARWGGALCVLVTAWVSLFAVGQWPCLP